MTTIRQAISTASCYVSVHGSRTSWEIYGPYSSDDLHGPSTSVSADSWHKAREIRSRWVARIACRLLGVSGEAYHDAEYTIINDGMGTREAVELVMRDHRQRAT